MKHLQDYQGYPIRITEERLTHILEHPEMTTLQDKIEETLKQPEQVRQSMTDASVLLSYRYYIDTLFGDKWLCVVVKYLGEDAFVLTAYLTNRIKKGRLL